MNLDKMENNKDRHQPSSSKDSKDSSKDKSDNSKKYNFYKKPPIKKKAPEVKQTRTSLKRMMQANPLLKYEMDGIPLPSTSLLSRQTSQNDLNKNMQVISSNVPEKNTKSNNLSKTGAIKKLAGNEPNPNARLMSLNSARLSNVDFNETGNILTSTVLEAGSAFKSEPKTNINSQSQENSKVKAVATHLFTKTTKNISNSKQRETNGHGAKRSKSKVLKGDNKPLKRSISDQHIDRQSGLPNTQAKETNDSLQAAKSLENISTPIQVRSHHKFSPTAEISQVGNLVLKTPTAYEKRSVFKFTPRSIYMSRRSIYQSANDLPTLEDLQKSLNVWLIKRGKSASLFADLKSFQPPVVIDENIENIEVNVGFRSSSYDDLRVVQTEDGSEKVKIKDSESENLEHVAKAALADLNHLARGGYPIKECEGWLELIITKCGKLQEEPEYWECLAAIEQSRGNITSAVEYYRNAIVQGAEVQEVDKSLDILLQKFSLLNISTDNSENEKMTRERARIVQDARNVFKSSIIKFAVQEKKLRRNEAASKLIATPVRRSIRLSRSAYTSTPGVKVCSSSKELDSPD